MATSLLNIAVSGAGLETVGGVAGGRDWFGWRVVGVVGCLKGLLWGWPLHAGGVCGASGPQAVVRVHHAVVQAGVDEVDAG